MNKSLLKTRLPIIFLFILTLFFGLVIVVSSYFIQRDLAPDDSSAAGTCTAGTKVLLYGDGITADHGSTRFGTQYQNLLQQKLGSDFQVIINGKPLHSVFSPIKSIQTEILDKDPDIVLLWWGVNENGNTADHGRVYREIVTELKKRNIPVAFITANPICYKDYNVNEEPKCLGYPYPDEDLIEYSKKVKKIVDYDKTLATELNVPLYDLYSVINYQIITTTNPDCCMPFFVPNEGVRINEKGHDLMAQIASAGVKNDLCKLLPSTTATPTTSTTTTPTPTPQCGTNPRVRFETGDITNWVAGNQIDLTAPVTDLHINCFTEINGSLTLIPNGQVVIEGTSSGASYPKSDPRNVEIEEPGNYGVTCKSAGLDCAEDVITVKSSGTTTTPTATVTPTPTGSITPTPTVGPNNCPAGTTIRFEQDDITNWQTAAQLGLTLPAENVHINCFTNNGTALLDGGDIRVVGPDYLYIVDAPEARNITKITQSGEYTAQCKLDGAICAKEKFTLGGNAVPGCGPVDNNGDLKIDLKDFSAFARVYKTASCGAIGTTTPPPCGFKDNNTDGKLDIKDFANFARKYNTVCGAN